MVDATFFRDADAFRCWLETHHGTASELWLGYHRKSTGHQSLTWSASVDVALCFGWIDGIRKSIDAQSFRIRFTPRKASSVWSAVNVRKVQEQIELGNMTPTGLRLFNQRTDAQGYSVDQRNIPLPGAYERTIRDNPAAWRFFSGLAPSYRRETVWWVMSAKKEETRLKRLGLLISCAEAGQKIPVLSRRAG